MITKYSSEHICLVCESTDIVVFAEISQVPVHCNILWKTREEASQAPKGDIELGFCGGCGHIFNMSFDPDRVNYNEAYENSLHFSPRFQEYAEALATRLIDRHHLRGKDIVEIGCGDGTFLSMLCEFGGNCGVGFDPGCDGRKGTSKKHNNMTFISDVYSERYADHMGDLVCCRHVLEHIPDPREFLVQLNRRIRSERDTVVYFEVPNVMYTLQDAGIWDIIYEHCSYFSIPSFTRLFLETAFVPIDVSVAFGNQYLCLEASKKQGKKNGGWDFGDEIREIVKIVHSFAKQYEDKLDLWSSNLYRMMEDGKRMVLWGAGSKGVTFLNTLPRGAAIHHVVDINPRKHGMYVPGTGQQIVSPEQLAHIRPDVILVMNPLYTDEIGQQIARMKLDPEIMVA